MINKLFGNQKIRYILGGLLSFVVEYSTFVALFYLLHFNENVAHSISFVLSILVNFSLLKFWIFKSGNNSKFSSEALGYFILVGINFILSNIIIYIFIQYSIPAYLAKFLTACAIVVWNYFIFKKLIFRERKKV